MPKKLRGKAYYSHHDLASMQRSYPETNADHVAYVSTKGTDVAFKDALKDTYTWIGEDAIGCLSYAASKTLAVVFPTVDLRDNYVNKNLPVTNLLMYTNPTYDFKLKRFTINGAPFTPLETLLHILKEAFAATGKIVEFVPLLAEDTK